MVSNILSNLSICCLSWGSAVGVMVPEYQNTRKSSRMPFTIRLYSHTTCIANVFHLYCCIVSLYSLWRYCLNAANISLFCKEDSPDACVSLLWVDSNMEDNSDDVLYGVKAKYRGNNPLCKLEKSVRGTQKISMNVGSLSVEDWTALICIHSPKQT